MTALKTTDLVLPHEVIAEINKKVKQKSVVGSLITSEMQTFEDRSYMVFTQEPEAEYVGEGGAKSSATVDFDPITATGHKLQVTVRVSDEVRWADEDGQLEVLNTITGAFGDALARGVDAGILHKTNPLDKSTVTAFASSAIVPNATVVDATTDAQKDLDGLADAIIENYDVNGIALDRVYANILRKLRNSDGQKLYPELGMNLDISSLDGIRAVVSGAVANRRYATTATGVKAIIGNWDLIKYGIVRNISVTPIEYGDPDGLGDLKRYNQIAYRAETYFSYANFDPAGGFAVLKEKPATPSSK